MSLLCLLTFIGHWEITGLAEDHQSVVEVVGVLCTGTTAKEREMLAGWSDKLGLI